MRKTIKLSLIAASVLALTACNQEAKKEQQVEVKLETEAQQQAYGIGASVGNFLNQDLADKKELGVELDEALLKRGFEDALAGNAKLDDEKIREVLTALDQSIRTKQQEKAKVEAEQSKAEGEKYLAENAKKEGVTVTESGLQYEVISQGDGEKPVATDVVKVHYKGTLLDGTEFDSSYSRNEPTTFPLNRVIPGWTEGLQLMPVGSKYKFTIPADLAYGERDLGKIPANSTLVFEVELLEIQSEEKAAAAE
ncbi:MULTISPECIES: FKBP-type peptidyl-prolyl cis-trans isomerase [Pseudoalteromonas]|mgnify:FL=1|jgi:FKBP-type peptidyl-prolyl cis-trans isomerase FkpA|uniref:Peptidyl-prolyl cis-trans isomerase n=1 Tax=Pseudoalteromonas lipolytica TaxID=570156 RepID=A0AAD0WDM7_9GAMM|nr:MULTISPECIES: FKBP-type peptidyl-prolyl cis-trans isomerase [Pseudoalteromonas]AXV66639.1 FKBP-type peptidyl-prolyl cis-trans isomerase [Pseudoalteromonas donghaensis]MBE0349440.1 FKBP-type peptidyl-prolyl cis-trans isomerase FkpA [Pseudoalteromonas lipolytica LMEB 39]MCC9661701.1 FKBP-type peptidyl-prolyl cis-trans isomerase [Pseudoalteromonas sp. MB41]QLJ08164.1 FKBP-type peptidyl-prolyl cis-trans isomerase [Pseudoalteromonas sp. JSTW]QMW14396.1 FKBP-type peptidyl-prolyl cis-trans isomera|tara:strand:+ start:97 stop:852 length:756 start_codon:yes stop_codon:yes gene_type:complete